MYIILLAFGDEISPTRVGTNRTAAMRTQAKGVLHAGNGRHRVSSHAGRIYEHALSRENGAYTLNIPQHLKQVEA